ncbi:MAG: hypothetical protein R3202_12075 [Candidatus Competibacterales bacterium]|nr:hypothetical protein [Candidatus Competibacterales bacterium]
MPRAGPRNRANTLYCQAYLRNAALGGDRPLLGGMLGRLWGRA